MFALCVLFNLFFEFNDFKWQVCKGVSIKNALQEIQEMPDIQYQELQEKGKQYTEDYFYKVTPERLSLFLPIVDC